MKIDAYCGVCVGGPYNGRLQKHYTNAIHIEIEHPPLGPNKGHYQHEGERWWWIDAAEADLFTVTDEDLAQESEMAEEQF
jgi:hypothetical protein